MTTPFVKPFINLARSRSSYDAVTNLIDMLLLHTDISFIQKCAIKALRSECTSLHEMYVWFHTNLGSVQPTDLFELVNTIVQSFGREIPHLAAKLDETTNVISVFTLVTTPVNGGPSDLLDTNDNDASDPSDPPDTTIVPSDTSDFVPNAYMSTHNEEPDEEPNDVDAFSDVKNGSKIKFMSEPAIPPVLTSNSYGDLAHDDDDDDLSEDPFSEVTSNVDREPPADAEQSKNHSFLSSHSSFSTNGPYKTRDELIDAKLRFTSDGYVQIDTIIYDGHSDKIGVQDLVWWISHSNRRNATLQKNFRMSISCMHRRSLALLCHQTCQHFEQEQEN